MARVQFKFAALLAAAMILPLLILELIFATKGETWVTDSVALFSFLWVLAFGFASLLSFIVQSTRSGTCSGWPGLVAGVLILLVIGVVLSTIVADQMPCFLGVPNCD